MNLAKYIKCFCLSLSLAFLLAGCGGPEQAQTEPGVQDIEPGQKSVIQPPAASGEQRSRLEERSL